MKTIAENLTQYAAYHRDRRNIATHFVGIPLIVFAIVLALATVELPLGPVALTAAAAVSIVLCAYYLRLDLGMGLAMAVLFFLMCAGASEMTHRLGTGPALAWAGGLFVAGWGLQFLGHKYEGVKPAFVDDARQLFIGPLFVLAEALFALGARKDLQGYIEARVGPTVPRRDGRAIPIWPEGHEEPPSPRPSP